MSVSRIAAAALAVVLLMGGVASADPPHDRDRRDHHVRHYAPPPRAWGYGQPTYVQAPPPVVYAPPALPAVLNFGITLPIR
jgi:hypothetical protein